MHLLLCLCVNLFPCIFEKDRVKNGFVFLLRLKTIKFAKGERKTVYQRFASHDNVSDSMQLLLGVSGPNQRSETTQGGSLPSSSRP